MKYKYPQGPGWSPDGGKLWVKGDLMYWNDGSVWDMNDVCVIRYMAMNHTENYSEWSDEKRAATYAEAQVRYAESAKKEREWQELRSALRESAKAKLTEDEINACEL